MENEVLDKSEYNLSSISGLSMYIDEHILDSKYDQHEVYSNLVKLCRIMTYCEFGYDNSNKFAEDFPHYLANIVYMRMTSPRQFLDKSDDNYLTPIKSSLNYIKKIIYNKSLMFKAENYSQVFDYENNLEAYEGVYSMLSSRIESETSRLAANYISIYISNIPNIVDEVIKSYYTYSDNEFTLLHINIVSLIINCLTFTRQQFNRLDNLKTNCKKLNIVDTIESEYRLSNFNNFKLYNLDEDKYLKIVQVLFNKVKDRVIRDISELSNDFKTGDYFVEDIIMSQLNDVDGGQNEEA